MKEISDMNLTWNEVAPGKLRAYIGSFGQATVDTFGNNHKVEVQLAGQSRFRDCRGPQALAQAAAATMAFEALTDLVRAALTILELSIAPERIRAVKDAFAIAESVCVHSENPVVVAAHQEAVRASGQEILHLLSLLPAHVEPPTREGP